MASESLYVHVVLKNGETVLAGQCVRNAAAKQGGFRYSKEFLTHPEAFALDPINLPLENRTFSFAYNREEPGIPGVLLDAGPDDWGKKLLTATREPPPTTDIEFLLAGSGTSIGCLLFSKDKQLAPAIAPERPFSNLDDVMQVAQSVQAKVPVNPQQALFFRRGESLGGSRPKTLISHKGAEWLAKFPQESDLFDNPLAEHVAMTMARAAGIETPETELVKTDRGNVLLVKRFDQGENGEASHMISMHSLINCFTVRKRKDEEFSYLNVARLGNSLSGKEVINKAIFCRMAFNVAIGNTDDHMRNHALIRRPDRPHYQLTPAYDLVPNPGLIGSHAIGVGPMGSRVSVDNIMGAAKQLGINEDDAAQILNKVLDSTRQWRDRCKSAGMTSSDIAVIGQAIDYGRKTIQAAVKRDNQLSEGEKTSVTDVRYPEHQNFNNTNYFVVEIKTSDQIFAKNGREEIANILEDVARHIVKDPLAKPEQVHYQMKASNAKMVGKAYWTDKKAEGRVQEQNVRLVLETNSPSLSSVKALSETIKGAADKARKGEKAFIVTSGEFRTRAGTYECQDKRIPKTTQSKSRRL
jgi:serine/threonine-protein kinase HipA